MKSSLAVWSYAGKWRIGTLLTFPLFIHPIKVQYMLRSWFWPIKSRFSPMESTRLLPHISPPMPLENWTQEILKVSGLAVNHTYSSFFWLLKSHFFSFSYWYPFPTQFIFGGSFHSFLSCNSIEPSLICSNRLRERLLIGVTSKSSNFDRTKAHENDESEISLRSIEDAQSNTC